MNQSINSLRSIDWQLLDTIGAALTGIAQDIPIEHRPLQGWPFAWLLHPGFNDGLTVGDSTSLYRLQDTGLINVFQAPDSRSGDSIVLTRRGRELLARRLEQPASQRRSSSSDTAAASHRESGWH